MGGLWPAAVIAEAKRSHPLLLGPDGYSGSTSYGGMSYVQDAFGADLPVCAEPVDVLDFSLRNLRGVRQLVARHARAAGVAGDARDDLALADHAGEPDQLQQPGAGSVGELQRLVHAVAAVAGRRVVGLQRVDRVEPQLRRAARAEAHVQVQPGERVRGAREEVHGVPVGLAVHDPVLAFDQIQRHRALLTAGDLVRSRVKQ